MDSFTAAASRLQRFFKIALARKALRTLRAVAARTAALVTAFHAGLMAVSESFWSIQQSICDADASRVEEHGATALLDQTGNLPATASTKDGQRQLAKEKKAVWKWWLKHERPAGAHCDLKSGLLHEWFHGQIPRDGKSTLFAALVS